MDRVGAMAVSRICGCVVAVKVQDWRLKEAAGFRMSGFMCVFVCTHAPLVAVCPAQSSLGSAFSL